MIGLQYFYAFQTGDWAGIEDTPFLRQLATNAWWNATKRVKVLQFYKLASK